METLDNLLDQMLSHEPSQSTLILILEKLKEKGETNKVIQESLKALNSYPDNICIRSLLSESYLDAGFIGQAEAEMDKTISRINDLISAFKLQARIYTRQNRFEDAAEALKKYLVHRPDNQDALDLLERIKPVEEEPEPKEDIVTELATPTLADLYYSQGQIQEAISTYEKVLLKNPEDKASAHRLAEIRASTSVQTEKQLRDKNKVKEEKIRLIAILEEWQSRIQGLSHVS